jgi:glycosyltransferase involved in cell wall biosynthesis
MKEQISLIVPCYNESEALPYFIPELNKVMNSMDYVNFEVILVNDGSRDDTLEKMKAFAAQDPRIKYISFSRNFGKEAAMYAGLCNASGDYVAFMDADMQDPPSLLPQMYHAVKEEGYDSAATRRVSRKGEPPVRSFFAHCFYRLINKISDADIEDGARDFRLMNRKFADALLSMTEYNRFSKGLFGWVGFQTKWIEFENVERVAGQTKWSFWSLFKYSLEGITAFSTTPLLISSFTGLFFCIVSLFAMIFVFMRAIIFGDPVSGWPSLVCIITLLGGLQLFTLGIVGNYLAKMYLEIKGRPIYIIKDTNIEALEN